MKRTLVSFSILAVTLIVGSVFAQQPPSGPSPGQPPPTASAVPRWKLDQQREILRREGEAFVQQERWSEAIEKFRAAIAIRPDPAMLLWIGFAEDKLGNLLKAKGIYQQAQAEARAAKVKRDEEGAEQALAELGGRIPRFIIKVPAGIQADVRVDDLPIASSTEEVELDPGIHVVHVTSPGRSVYHVKEELKAGDVKTLDVKLPLKPVRAPVVSKPMAPPATPSTGRPVAAIGVSATGTGAMVVGGILLGVGLGDNDGTKAQVGGAILAGGILVGAGGLAWWILSDPKGTDPSSSPGKGQVVQRLLRSVDIALVPHRQGAAVGVGGQF